MENWAQKLVTAEEETAKIINESKNEEEERKSGCPSLLNLDYDQQNDRKMFYNLEKLKVCNVGMPTKNSTPNIAIQTAGICENHAVFECEGDVASVRIGDQKVIESSGVCVNGVKLTNTDKCLLNHNDRIVVGEKNVFLFKHARKMD